MPLHRCCSSSLLDILSESSPHESYIDSLRSLLLHGDVDAVQRVITSSLQATSLSFNDGMQLLTLATENALVIPNTFQLFRQCSPPTTDTDSMYDYSFYLV